MSNQRKLSRLILPQDKEAIAKKEAEQDRPTITYVGTSPSGPVERMPPDLRREALRRLCNMPAAYSDRYRKECESCGTESAPLAYECDHCGAPLPYTPLERDLASAMWQDRLTSISIVEAAAMWGLMPPP